MGTPDERREGKGRVSPAAQAAGPLIRVIVIRVCMDASLSDRRAGVELFGRPVRAREAR